MTLSDEQKTICEAILAMIPGESIYVDGEAGTGKSFCLDIATEPIPNMIRCAANALAANNIKGRTFHKVFQLRGSLYLDPANWAARKSKIIADLVELNGIKSATGAIYKEAGMLMSRQMHPARQKCLAEAGGIWVDEIPTLRCDLLDEADVRLRHVMKKQKIPFGGMKMIFSGDLGQLQPVVTKDEIPALEEAGYEAPFGFQQSRVLRGY